MNWQVGKVSDIAEIISGYAFKSEWFNTGSNKIIRIGDLQNNLISDGETVTFDSEKYNVSDQFKIQEGDILMALSGATVGKIAIASKKDIGAYVNQRVAIIRGKTAENSGYLKYVFSGKLLQKLLLSAGGAAQPNLSPKNLADMEIPMPPLPEQKRIAAILDKADSLRRKNQQAIQLADKFLRAVFLDMFGDPVTNPKGWQKLTLSEVIKEGTLITYGIVQAGPEYENGVPYIRTGDFKNGLLVKSGYARTDPAIAEKFARSRVNTGDLVYCIRASIGSVDIVPKFLDGSNLTQGTAKISPGNNMKSEFLVELLRTKGFKSWVDTYSKGATFKEITLEKLREAPVIVPPLEIQNKFICIRRKVLDSIKHNQNNITELPLFESISQKAFAGDL